MVVGDERDQHAGQHGRHHHGDLGHPCRRVIQLLPLGNAAVSTAMSSAVCGAIGGFFNWHPSRMYTGDTGANWGF
jgi:hypothetical protein